MGLTTFPPIGDVQGPASATDGHVALFDGITGKIIRDGGAPAGGTIGGSTGGVDNAALRADGIGGSTLQTSALIIADTTGNISGLQQATFSGTTSGTLVIKPAAIAGTNTLTFPAGTTDFSATGGTSQVVKQTSAGGALTVAQLAASDLSNGTTGSGAVTLANTPTLITPVLGVATASSVNKFVFTAPTTAATLTPSADNVVSTLPSTTGTLINRVEVPYDLSCQFVGVPAASAVGLRFPAVRAFTLAASGHQAKAGTAATAQTDFILAVNGVTKATLRFAAAATTCSIVGGTAATIAAADVITLTAPASADATLADIGFGIAAVLI